MFMTFLTLCTFVLLIVGGVTDHWYESTGSDHHEGIFQICDPDCGSRTMEGVW